MAVELPYSPQELADGGSDSRNNVDGGGRRSHVGRCCKRKEQGRGLRKEQDGRKRKEQNG
jgi:hypothetical protein